MGEGVKVTVGAGDGAGVAVGRGVGTGVGAGTGTGVEEAGWFTDSEPEGSEGWGVAAGSGPAAGTRDGKDTAGGRGDAVGKRTGVAAAGEVTGDGGEMCGRINDPANIRDDPGWTGAGVGEGITRAVGGAAVT